MLLSSFFVINGLCNEVKAGVVSSILISRQSEHPSWYGITAEGAMSILPGAVSVRGARLVALSAALCGCRPAKDCCRPLRWGSSVCVPSATSRVTPAGCYRAAAVTADSVCHPQSAAAAAGQLPPQQPAAADSWSRHLSVRTNPSS